MPDSLKSQYLNLLRFHVVSSSNDGYIGPEPYESQDIKLLRLEKEAAELDMKKMTELRAECALLGKGKGNALKSTTNFIQREQKFNILEQKM